MDIERVKQKAVDKGLISAANAEKMSESEQARARLLFKTLIYPEGMGHTFQVLIQHKNVASPQLSGLDAL